MQIEDKVTTPHQIFLDISAKKDSLIKKRAEAKDRYDGLIAKSKAQGEARMVLEQKKDAAVIACARGEIKQSELDEIFDFFYAAARDEQKTIELATALVPHVNSLDEQIGKIQFPLAEAEKNLWLTHFEELKTQCAEYRAKIEQAVWSLQASRKFSGILWCHLLENVFPEDLASAARKQDFLSQTMAEWTENK